MTAAQSIKAVIFDLDGVLVDSEPAHQAASRRLVAPAVMTDEEYGAFVGSSIEAFMAWVQERFLPGLTIEEIVACYDALVLAELRDHPPPAFDGAPELLAALRGQGLPLAVASQSLPAWVEVTLSGACLTAYFDAVVTASEVAQHKPAPDLFLLAAHRLGVEPRACLVVEDSPPGVAAGVAAGMVVVQSRQGSMAPPPQAGAHRVIGTLRAFHLE